MPDCIELIVRTMYNRATSNKQSEPIMYYVIVRHCIDTTIQGAEPSHVAIERQLPAGLAELPKGNTGKPMGVGDMGRQGDFYVFVKSAHAELQDAKKSCVGFYVNEGGGDDIDLDNNFILDESPILEGIGQLKWFHT